MWVTRNRNNDLTLFVTKPVKDEKLGWWWIDERIIYLEYYDELSGQFISLVDHQFDYVKWEDDEPLEITVLPKPTEETIISNPTYKAIFDLGKDDAINYSDIATESNNRIANELGIYKQQMYCKNGGHPWCHNGYYRCDECKEWSFDVVKYIKLLKENK